MLSCSLAVVQLIISALVRSISGLGQALSIDHQAISLRFDDLRFQYLKSWFSHAQNRKANTITYLICLILNALVKFECTLNQVH